MEITKTRTYRFTTAELNAINTFYKIVDSICITEQTDNYNDNYSSEAFFNAKYEEYINNGQCESTFQVNVDD